ncbi:hypothetical protein GCM10025857_37580 [Alicyclobacillus contaminans]|uniref:DUF2273 domain-containing protein n=1 Tax=Alicyclobacillus contaminans TaxID=392016 RepID=UPI000403B591|nr:DUF2273 domain-containing protein [Alicyclobacillus contaminans]GMA52401.1 hypothetical protein GCM10025857_37580 [Alicyclobacillus contaminans]
MAKLRQWALMLLGLRRRWLGCIAGCILWVFWMVFGLWSTLALLVLATAGFAVGRILEEHQSWKDVVDKLLADRFNDS